jgi:8-oxo-dGTP diphosphatase
MTLEIPGLGYPKIGTCAVVRKEGKVLLGKRISKHAGGNWAFPGGHLEYLEDPIDCIRRETLEETGLTVGEVKLWCFTNDLYPEEGRHYITLVYFAEYIGGEPQVMEPQKCGGWDWFDWDNTPQPMMKPCQKMMDMGLHPFKEKDVTALEKKVAELTEWRNAISGIIKMAPEFAPGEWGGDKEGWGRKIERLEGKAAQS